jgi:Family of unknown function (DUF5317)
MSQQAAAGVADTNGGAIDGSGPGDHVTRSQATVFLFAAVVLILISARLAGGRLERLAQLQLRGKVLIFGALAVQVLIVNIVPGGDPGLHRILHLGTYVLAAAFLFANRRIPGMWMIAAGAFTNVTAIALNNGVMPASATALRSAGEMPTGGSFLNSALVAHPRFLFLGDVFAIPKMLPLHNVFSVGDVCIALGAAVGIHTISGSRFAWSARPRDDQSVEVVDGSSCSMNSSLIPPGASTNAMRRLPNAPSTTAGPHTTV